VATRSTTPLLVPLVTGSSITGQFSLFSGNCSSPSRHSSSNCFCFTILYRLGVYYRRSHSSIEKKKGVLAKIVVYLSLTNPRRINCWRPVRVTVQEKFTDKLATPERA
jgi:hypothetical protein